MSGDENHTFLSSHQLYPTTKPSSFHHIDIPPRKLIFNSDMFTDSPKYFSDEDSDPYSSDHFRMYEFKIRRCTRSRSHDWTDCPFAHPGEKARRRDPRKYRYNGTICPEFRQGGCSRGENCEFAHGVFECWLHPSRYRTEACKDGEKCTRKVCFFAHTPQQLRILPANVSGNEIEISRVSGKKHGNSNLRCACCNTSSPTSTLMGLPRFSPPASPSPPLSPLSRRCSSSKFSPFCRLGENLSYNNGEMLKLKDINDLICSMEAMNVRDAQNQQQFKRSDSNYPSGYSNDYDDNGWSCPDLGWVNDLLM